ncbi:hypothetical protein PJI16_02195 [Nitrospira sp. MA-1]|nr:hypothetical protein [Nitrospira sp. MA-1]
MGSVLIEEACVVSFIVGTIRKHANPLSTMTRPRLTSGGYFGMTALITKPQGGQTASPTALIILNR